MAANNASSSSDRESGPLNVERFNATWKNRNTNAIDLCILVKDEKRKRNSSLPDIM